MGKDYYNILGVQKGADENEIKKAYRKMALKWHPDRHQGDEARAAAAKKFQEISEAYEVLSDPQKKAAYDQFGEAAVNGAASSGGGGVPGGFGGGGSTFHFTATDPSKIFAQFFGTSNPFEASDSDDVFGGMGGAFPPGMAGMFSSMGNGGGGFTTMRMGGNMPRATQSSSSSSSGGQQVSTKKADPIHYPLKVSLEDLYSGCTKRMKITRKIYDTRTRTQSNQDIVKEIPVRPGWKDGTKITYEKEGDQKPGVVPADIIFTLETKPHDRFERKGNDLHYTANIDLADAMDSVTTYITTLDDRAITVREPFVTPDTVTCVQGEGMPVAKRPTTKGNLYVKYHVRFPPLNKKQRTDIAAIARGSMTY